MAKNFKGRGLYFNVQKNERVWVKRCMKCGMGYNFATKDVADKSHTCESRNIINHNAPVCAGKLVKHNY